MGVESIVIVTVTVKYLAAYLVTLRVTNVIMTVMQCHYVVVF
jgi:hypothetical protein